MRALLRGSLATLVGSVSLFVASTAFADGEPCFNDTDCPGTACGDAVCNWNKPHPAPDGRKSFTCNPAGTSPAGSDGWCETDANCKCMAQGAKCTAPFCTFTKPMAGSTGGSSSTGGASSTGGTPASTGGTPSTGGTTGGTPPSTGGTPASTGGTPASTGGTATSTGGSTTAPPPTDDGGCSVNAPGRANTGAALGVGLLAVGLAFARRRRR